jgi:hypothetical protein
MTTIVLWLRLSEHYRTGSSRDDARKPDGEATVGPQVRSDRLVVRNLGAETTINSNEASGLRSRRPRPYANLPAWRPAMYPHVMPRRFDRPDWYPAPVSSAAAELPQA